MKKIKILFVLFGLTCMLPMANIKAVNGFADIANITLPKSGSDWYYSGRNYTKTEVSNQWYKNFGAFAVLGNTVDIKIRTYDGSVNSSWMTLSLNEMGSWGSGTASSANFLTGTYGVDIARKSSGLSSVEHSGLWWLNESLNPNI